MRVLVTGGAGYIGSIVTEQLIQSGHEAVVLDSLEKGHRGAVAAGASFVQGSLLNDSDLQRVFNVHRVDSVIHMAAHSLVGESVIQPDKYYKNNVEAGLKLLDAMKKHDVKRIVFSSTAAVYGEPQKQPIEETDPTNPANPYGETKLAFEKALMWYEKAYGIRYTSLRYFNAAGASELFGEVHDPETHLIPIVLQAAMGKLPQVEVFGDDYPTRDGTCVRDYIHVIDLARAHILALKAIGEESGVFNLGCGGNGYTVREVIDIASKITGKKIPYRIGARRAGDPAVLVASSDRIASRLGWKPELQSLSHIIESAWKWALSHPNGYV